MNILRESNPNILGFLGGFLKRYKDLKYRFNTKIIMTEYLDRVIIYNGLTGAVVSLYDFEYDNIWTDIPQDYTNFLYNNYFFVREEFDENKIIDDFKKSFVKYIAPTYLDKFSHYTILTTSKCNARCPYCYELGLTNKHDMTEETARDIVKFIVEHSEPGRSISFEWFGGEPMTNSRVIDIISSGVCSAGINATSSMITNGYLFNDDYIARAKSIWKLTNVQITLDGLEDDYNKTKRYIYKDDPNPFKTVISNIHKLLRNKINVSIRLNCDKNNYRKLIKLVDFLGNEFRGYDNISVYVWEIFSETKRTEEEADEQFKCMEEVDKVIFEKGFQSPSALEGGIKSQHCLVDTGQGTCIDMDGNLFLCEHYINNDSYSTIYHPEVKDFSVFEKWRNYTDNHSEQCLECPLRPTCLKMQRCTDQYECVGYEQLYHINQVKRHLIICQEQFNNPICNLDGPSCCTQN